MAPPAVSARNAGLALISRINRWMIAVALGLTGVVSVAAAKSFHGHTKAHTAAPAQSPSFAPTGRRGAGGLQPPARAPGPAPASPGPAVSGGS